MPTPDVLVTGGAGFVGSALVTDLVDAGHSVLVLDSLATGRRANLAHLPPGRVELVEGDVRDQALVAQLVARVPLVFHLACINLRRALTAPREAHDVNATATLDLVTQARLASVRRFVHVSSSEVYGSARAATIDESHPTLPTTDYGASKLAGEACARAAWHTHGFPVAIVRPFNAYGPRSHAHGTSGEVIPRFITRALQGEPLVMFGDGDQTRDFTHVSDTARGLRLVATRDVAVGGTFNLGTGCETSVRTLATLVSDLTGRPVPVLASPARPGDIGRQAADARRARATLGWTPRVSLVDGLRDLVAWHRSGNGERPVADEPVRNWEAVR